MAKQKGPIFLVGTIGGVNYYFRKGVALARVSGGGFNGKSIKIKANMGRVRENYSEFGFCSRIKSRLRIALMPFLHLNKDGSLHDRMMGLLMEIKELDIVSTRGQRKVGLGLDTPKGELILRSFEFTPKCKVQERLGSEGVYNVVDYSYTVTKFSPGKIVFPAGATHAEVRIGILNFNFETLEEKLFLGAPLIIGYNFEPDSFVLEPEKVPEGDGIKIGFVGLHFCQEVGGVMYPFKGENTIGLEIVGTSR